MLAPYRFFIVTLLLAAVAVRAEDSPTQPNSQQPLANSPSVSVTFTRDIAPIFFKNCASCHHPGEVAPFSLLNYADAATHAKTIARVTAKRFMPPWKAEPGAGIFRDVRRLSDAEIELIQHWVEAGTPEGDPKALPPLPTFADDWKLGRPDLILSMPQAFSIPAEGKDIYQCFVVPLHLSGDEYLSGFEYHPGNRRVVHHAIVSQDNTGEALKKDAQDPDVGYREHGTGTGLAAGWKAVLGLWTPGFVPSFLPENVGMKLDRNSVIVIQIHYHPSGKPETDQSSVGLYFSKRIPEIQAGYITIFNNNLNIPPNEPHFHVAAHDVARGNARVLAIIPHMHLLGQEMKIRSTAPDGSSRPMVWVRNWDFNWQNQYFYQDPVRVLKGTHIDLDAWYDNTSANPRNPSNPPRMVHFGENTTDEMLGVILLVAPDKPLNRAVVQLNPQMLGQYVGRYDLGAQKLLKISLEFGTLMAQLNADPKIDLFAESETEFFSRVPDASVHFLKNSHGQVEAVNVIVDGQNHHGKKLQE